MIKTKENKRAIKVYHAKEPMFDINKHLKWNEENYEKVAEFFLPLKGTPTQCAEIAFLLTNGVKMVWFKNTKLNWIAKNINRPTSLGDVIMVDGVSYKCKSLTWSIIK